MEAQLTKKEPPFKRAGYACYANLCTTEKILFPTTISIITSVEPTWIQRFKLQVTPSLNSIRLFRPSYRGISDSAAFNGEQFLQKMWYF